MVRIGWSGETEPAWKSMLWPIEPWLTRVTTNVSPTRPCSAGPGTVPPKVHIRCRTPGATSMSLSTTGSVTACSVPVGAGAKTGSYGVKPPPGVALGSTVASEALPAAAWVPAPDTWIAIVIPAARWPGTVHQASRPVVTTPTDSRCDSPSASRRVCGPSATLRSCRPRSRLVTSRTRFVPAGTSMERGSIVMSPSDTATTWVPPAAREVLAPPAAAPWPRLPTAIAAPSSTMARPTAPATTTARRPEPGPVPAGAEAVGAGGGGGVSAVTNRLAASSTKAPSAATTSVHPSAVRQDGPDTARPSTPRLTATMRGSHACSSVAVACRAPAAPRPSTTGSRKVSAPVSTWPTKPTSSTGTNRSSGTATAATSGARQATATLEQAWLPRIVAVNLGVLGLAVSGPSWLTALGWTLVVAALGAFVLLAASLLVTAEAPPPPPAPTASAPAGTGPGSGRRAVVVAGAVGLAIVLLGAAIAVGDLGHGAAAGGASTSRAAGATQVVAVSLGDMTIEPRSIDVPAGTNLVLDVTNRDRGRHDLKVADGPQTRRLAEGESQRLSVGVVTTGLDAWCTVPGHRAAGMTMAIHVSGAGTQAAAGSASDATVDPKATPGGGFTPYDPVLAPAPAGTEHAVTLPVVDRDIEVAPGVRQRMWTFGGTVPGPALHGRVGDTFVVTLVNHGSMGHSIDFHAGSVSPDQPMRTIQPGESLVYRFTAGFAGAWMYHCGTAPMLDHIANGMYGAVVIDPPGLPPVDREFALVQSELYLGPPNGTADDAKLRARTADAVVFNGYVRQYDAVPLTAEPGQRVRIVL